MPKDQDNADIEMVDMGSTDAAKATQEAKPAPNDESLEIEGMGQDTSAVAVEAANKVDTLNQALNLLKNPEAQVNSDQLEKAINIAAETLDGINGFESERERDIKAAIAHALKQMNNDEQSREFLINYLEWCRDQLNAQQDANALRAAALESATIAPAFAPAPTPAPAIALTEISEQAKALLSILIRTPEGKEIQASLNNTEALKKSGLEYTPGENGGSTVTRVSEEGSSSPYSAHFSPDGKGGFKVAIRGSDLKQGLKDTLGVFKDAGVTAVNISGSAITNRTDAYETLKTALEVEGITSILGDEGVYGSMKLFAEESANANPASSEAETKAYFQAIVKNDKLRPQLINEMVENQGANRAELEGLSHDALVQNCLDAMMPQPAVEESQGISISDNGRTVVMNGVQGKSVTTSSAESVISDTSPTSTVREKTPRRDSMIAQSGHMREAADMKPNPSPGGNTSTMVMDGKKIRVRHEESGTIRVNGHKMPGEYPYEAGMRLQGAADGKSIMVNGKQVEVTEDGLKVDGQKVNPEAKSGQSGLLARAAATPGSEGTISPVSSPSSIPQPFETPTLRRGGSRE